MTDVIHDVCFSLKMHDNAGESHQSIFKGLVWTRVPRLIMRAADEAKRNSGH